MLKKSEYSQFKKELSRATPAFDLHGFDTDLATALGVETPDNYAQRKAEDEGLAIPLGPLDQYSMGRKLVSLLGPDWTWSLTDTGGVAQAQVWNTKTGTRFEADGTGPVSLRSAALIALEERAAL
jgi:hypothetical protein